MPLGQPTSYLLTASNHTAAEVTTGLGVDHSGDILFALEVCEVLLSPLSLLPVEPKCPVTYCLAGRTSGEASSGVISSLPKLQGILLLGLFGMHGSNMSPFWGPSVSLPIPWRPEILATVWPQFLIL